MNSTVWKSFVWDLVNSRRLQKDVKKFSLFVLNFFFLFIFVYFLQHKIDVRIVWPQMCKFQEMNGWVSPCYKTFTHKNQRKFSRLSEKQHGMFDFKYNTLFSTIINWVAIDLEGFVFILKWSHSISRVIDMIALNDWNFTIFFPFSEFERTEYFKHCFKWSERKKEVNSHFTAIDQWCDDAEQRPTNVCVKKFVTLLNSYGVQSLTTHNQLINHTMNYYYIYTSHRDNNERKRRKKNKQDVRRHIHNQKEWHMKKKQLTLIKCNIYVNG